MKPTQIWIVGIAATLMLAGCGSKRVKLTSENRTQRNGVVVEAEWIKDKGKKFDVRLVITNETQNDIIITLSDMSCSRGEAQGEIRHTFFNTGERVIDIRKGRAKAFQMVCSHKEKAKGFYKVFIGRVFDNPGSDGVTRGKVIVTDLGWSAPDGGA